MTLLRPAAAGTFESSDAYVVAEPAEELTIDIKSVVFSQFGDQIEASIRDVLNELGVTGGRISINDMGAIDCVIRARVETAVRRAAKGA